MFVIIQVIRVIRQVIWPFGILAVTIALDLVLVVAGRRSLIFKSLFNNYIPERLVS